jgi:hypothetical protein
VIRCFQIWSIYFLLSNTPCNSVGKSSGRVQCLPRELGGRLDGIPPHSFDRDCVNKWLRRHVTCLMCLQLVPIPGASTLDVWWLTLCCVCIKCDVCVISDVIFVLCVMCVRCVLCLSHVIFMLQQYQAARVKPVWTDSKLIWMIANNFQINLKLFQFKKDLPEL